MPGKLVREKIGSESYINFINTDKFRSDRITLSFVTPLDRDKATVNALVPFILRKGCRSCPDFTALNRKLAEMYGAVLDADVSKLADSQIIEISLTFVDDRFAIDGEKMSEKAAELVADIALDPALDENGAFGEKDVELEKVCLADTIASELNEKRVYAVTKLCELIFEGEPFAVKRYGYLDRIDEITPQSAADAWRELVRTSRIEIMVTGMGDPGAVKAVFENRIGSLDRDPVIRERTKPLAYTEYKEGTEEMDIAQGKLVMGFRMGAPETEREKDAARLMAILYGATPFSKLFLNVREKMSLCYYASAHFERRSGIMLVDSGIEFKNYDAARSEIIRQLDLMKEGDFTDEELSETKLIIKSSLGSVDDSLSAMESWYMNGILDGVILTPEEDIENIYEITREEIVEAAGKAKLAACFFLKGAEKND